jgi:hypothetical protein
MSAAAAREKTPVAATLAAMVYKGFGINRL